MKRSPALRRLTGAVLVATAALAWAQAPQSPAPAPAAAPEAPAPKCGDLPEFPRKLAPESQKRYFERSLRDYGTCIRGYVEERNAAMNAQRKAVQDYIDAYNKALAAWQVEKEAAKAQ